MAEPTPAPSFPLPGRPERAFRAARGDRFAARVIDNLITLLPALLVGVVGGALAGPHGGEFAAITLAVLVALGTWGANMARLVRTGQTFGKSVMKIEMIHNDGTRADFVRGVLMREMAFFAAKSVPGIGPLLSLADGGAILLADRRCIHDYLCSTEVVSLKNLDDSVNSYAMADVFR